MTLEELVYIDENGYYHADYPAFLSWLETEYRSIYGEDVYLEPDSQDGQFLAVLALAFYQTATIGASVYNSFSPSTAQGVGLSRNVKINGLNRRAATYSTVDLTIVGQAGTVLGVVGAPAMAIDTLEQKWIIPIGTTIPGGGSITVTATAEEIGAVQAAANTVNRIFTPTRGWQTVNNATAASAGAQVEIDAELRQRQEVSTANPAQTVLSGTQGAVANLAGVTRVKAYENDTDAINGDGLPAHSISVVVEGGDITEICEAILLRKTPGTGTYGDTSETVTDPKGLPVLIAFQRPDLVDIDVEIVITPSSGYVTSTEDLIKQSVADAINALGIGVSVLYTKLFLAAYLQNTPQGGTFDIVSVEISRDGDPVGAANVTINWDEIAFCDPAVNITVID